MKHQKLLAWFMSLCLIVSLFTQPTFAENTANNGEATNTSGENSSNEATTPEGIVPEGATEEAITPAETADEDTIPAAPTPDAPNPAGETEEATTPVGENTSKELKADLHRTDFAKWLKVEGKNNFTEYNPIIINSPDSNDYVLFYRKTSAGDVQSYNIDSPLLENGEAEYIFRISDDETTDKDNIGRIGFIYRATDKGHAKLVYHNIRDGKGIWTLETGQNYSSEIEGPVLRADRTYKLKIAYTGTVLRVYINDTEVFLREQEEGGITTTVPQLDANVLGANGKQLEGYPLNAGHIGFRDHGGVKNVYFFSIKNGPEGTIPSLNMEEYNRALVEAVTKVNSSKYEEQGRIELRTLLEQLPDFYLEQSDIEGAKKVLEEKIQALKVQNTVMKTATISNDVMEVVVNTEFPQVVSYKMKNLDNKVMLGQVNPLKTLKINDVALVPEVNLNADESTAEKKVYDIHCEKTEGENKINCNLKAEITLNDDQLTWAITKIENLNKDQSITGNIIRKIEVPNLSIVSVNSNQENPGVNASIVTTNTRSKAGDWELALTNATRESKSSYYIATIHNSELAASMYTNTDFAVKSQFGEWNYTTVSVTAQEDGSKSVGLGSEPWVYQRDVDYRVQDGNFFGQTELPFIRVKVVGDENKDGKINWNDGALAYKAIKPYRYGSKQVPDTVAMRIAMNFGSHAQNPFLTSLDNVKKIYLHTDGLGQNVLLKGYGSEGHDSGHLNYADIGRRIGGAEDMKVLLAEGHKYGAKFGIHVNASETYPESKYFTEDRLRKDGEEYDYGWNWIDQGININADYDLKHGRAQRFADLAKALDRGDGKNDLDYIYVDVWGNGQSGDNSSWPSMQLAKEINQQGWAVAGEWGYAFAPVSILQHWAADVTYGGYSLKGINSKLIRFVENSERDSWTANYADYSGTAINPLLGGYNMKDFEGWQGRNGYAAYIYNLFRVNVPSKFVQHFQVKEWIDGTAVDLPYDVRGWIPEMKIKLENDGRELIITRNSNDYANDTTGYRSRTMTLDGKVILKEKPAVNAPTDQTVVEYLIPWNWDQNGKVLAENDQKLYAFSNKGEPVTWELPKGWSTLDSVYMYQLTDVGRTNEQIISVTSGAVTLNLENGMPYVIYKKSNPEIRNVEWSKGIHLTDAGFNSRNLAHWKINNGVEGENNGEKIAVVDTASGTQVLEVSNNKKDVSLTQQLVDLKPNTKYAAYVGVENRSDVKASLKVTQGDKVLSENYTKRSIALNFIQAYTHNTNDNSYTVREKNPYGRYGGTSYFQNMYVFFETGADTKGLTLTLGRQAGEGITYFDDIRIVENEGNPYKETAEGKVFVQDFENIAQGAYPFVLSGVEGVTDNRQHLSERHEPYTQRGWYKKILSDVIGGKWSLKTNGLITRNNMLYQTIPQNYRFEPGKTYRLSFDYLAGTDKAFDFVLGNGLFYGRQAEAKVFSESLAGTRNNSNDAEAGHYEFEFTVPEDKEDYWVGIYSNSTPADLTGIANRDANFSGAKDFVLDNLKIVEKKTVSVDKSVLKEVLKKAETIQNDPKVLEKYTKESVDSLRSAFLEGTKKLESNIFTQEFVDAEVEKINQAINGLEIYQPDTKLLQHYLRNAERILSDDTYAKEHKEKLREIVTVVKEFLKGDHLPQEQIEELSLNLKKAMDNVRVSKGEVEIIKVDEKINSKLITAIEASSEAPYDNGASKDKAVDGNPATFWHSDWQKGIGAPHYITLEFDKVYELTGMNYIHRYSNQTKGRPKEITIQTSINGTDWNDFMVGHNVPEKIEALTKIRFANKVEAKYVKFTILKSVTTSSDTTMHAMVGELEFMANVDRTNEINELPDMINANELFNLLKSANAEIISEKYPYASKAARDSFEKAMAKANEIIKALYKNDTTQEQVDKAKDELKKAKEALDGKENLDKKIEEAKAKFDKAAKESYKAETEKELTQILSELPKFSPIWMELNKKLKAYHNNANNNNNNNNNNNDSNSALIPYVPEGSNSTSSGIVELPKTEIPKSPTDENKKATPFKDVPANSWYEAAVKELYEKGYMLGISAEQFAPEMNVNRAMIPVVLFRLTKADPNMAVPESTFPDVEKGSWYEKGVNWAKEKGYVKGTDQGTYEPNQVVTRQDYIVIMYRYLNGIGQSHKQASATKFADYAEVSDYAQEAMHWATENEVIKGREDGKLHPKAKITRAEMATMLARLLKYFEK